MATSLSSSNQRGKWLGIINLTNTLPAILTPGLAIGAVEITKASGLTYLLFAAAAAACLASWLITKVASVR